MKLLEAARKVKRLGLTQNLQWFVGRYHVAEPRQDVQDAVGILVRTAFLRKPIGPDAAAWGPEVCEEACATFAVAVHRHNLKTYGRVISGRL
jgi:hypothetical protein